MKAVILAAGEGTRLEPATNHRPKPLLPVNGRPILSHLFDRVIEIGAEEAIVVVGYRKEAIVEAYGDAYRGLPITYAVQPEQTGLAHALLAAEEHLEEDFIVLNGDNIYQANLSAAVKHHQRTNADLTVLVDEVPPEQATAGAVFQVDTDGTLTGLVEKPAEPPSGLVPMACYVLPPDVFHACQLVQPSERGEYELPDAIDLLIRAGYTVETVPFEGWKINVNTPADLERAAKRLRSGQ